MAKQLHSTKVEWGVTVDDVGWIVIALLLLFFLHPQEHIRCIAAEIEDDDDDDDGATGERRCSIFSIVC